jgi:hypothetical protein
MKKRSISSDDKDAVKKRLFTEDESSTVEIPDTQEWSMEKDSVSEKSRARDLKARDETMDDEGAGASGGHNPDPMEIDTRYAR